MTLSDEQKEMLKPGPDVKSQAAVTIPARLRPQSAEAPPPLPTVGRIVHFYHSKCTPVGPYSAIVHQVRESSEVGSPIVVAEVDLTVSIGGALTETYKLGEFTEVKSYGPWKIFMDVPGIIPGVDHQHEYWWQWPPRS